MEVVCSIQDKLSLEEINSVLETPKEAIPKSQVLFSSTESQRIASLNLSLELCHTKSSQLKIMFLANIFPPNI
ncbi:hypothetical protein YC2023_051039 [Brassica napus]